MQVVVLGSGSRGNAVAVRAPGAWLLVDAGFSAREVRRRAQAAGLILEELVGIAVTHEHGDHARSACALARRHGIPLLATPGTLAAFGDAATGLERIPLGFGRPGDVGPFVLEACPTNHDAAEPVALVVRVGVEGPAVGVAHDLGRLSAALRWFLRDLAVLVLEANHDEVLLRASAYPASVRERIAGSGGHISNREAAELLAEVAHAGLHHVVLAHLSERCNTEGEALRAARRALDEVGWAGALHVARQDEPLGPLALTAPARASA